MSEARTVTGANHYEQVIGLPDASWLGSTKEVYDTLGSTQTRAMELLKQEKFGAVVLARSQTSGVGRMGNFFFSPKGKGLYCSVTLPPLPHDRFQLLSIWAGITLIRAIREAGVILNPVPVNLTKRLSLKWPNDILLDQKKLAGVLVSGVYNGQTPLGAVLGIGVNLSTTAREFPAELKSAATSIKIATHYSWDTDEFLTHVLSVIERMWERMLDPRDDLLAEWLRWGPPIGQSVRVRDGDAYIDGNFIGLNERGELVIELSGGERKSILSGIVEHVQS